MARSTRSLIALLTLMPALAGCSGFQPFWRSDAAQAAADRSVEGPLTLARLAEQQGKNLEAERLYRSLLEKQPDHPVIHHRLAIIQARKGRFDEANTYFDRALQLKSDDPTLICDAGYCLYLQHRLDQAEALFRRALDIDPHHEASTNNLALVLAEKGDDRGAMALFRQTGTEARAHANMGFVYTRRGELDKAKEAYSRALTLDPQMFAAAEALVQLAQFERQARATAAQSRPRPTGWAEYGTEPHAQHRLVNHEATPGMHGDETPPQPWPTSEPSQAMPSPAVSMHIVSPEPASPEPAPPEPMPPRSVASDVVPLPPVSAAESARPESSWPSSTSADSISPAGFSWASGH